MDVFILIYLIAESHIVNFICLKRDLNFKVNKYRIIIRNRRYRKHVTQKFKFQSQYFIESAYYLFHYNIATALKGSMIRNQIIM